MVKAKQASQLLDQGVERLVWVVPNDIFPKFGEQAFTSPDGKKVLSDKALKGHYSKLASLKQIVLCVDL